VLTIEIDENDLKPIKDVLEITEKERETARTKTFNGEYIKPSSFNVITDKIRVERDRNFK